MNMMPMCGKNQSKFNNQKFYEITRCTSFDDEFGRWSTYLNLFFLQFKKKFECYLDILNPKKSNDIRVDIDILNTGWIWSVVNWIVLLRTRESTWTFPLRNGTIHFHAPADIFKIPLTSLLKWNTFAYVGYLHNVFIFKTPCAMKDESLGIRFLNQHWTWRLPSKTYPDIKYISGSINQTPKFYVKT